MVGTLELVNLLPLMQITQGASEIAIGLIDGPVARNSKVFSTNRVRTITGDSAPDCSQASSAACTHGTFVAAILGAKRESPAPAICPGCRLLVRPVFLESDSDRFGLPKASPQELARAIVECVDAGARMINLSLALARPSTRVERELNEAVDYAMKRRVMVIAAAGNQGEVGSSSLLRHPWVLPVIAYDSYERPLSLSNLSASIGRRGIGAPGSDVTSLAASGKTLTMSGTSAATPFVTGTLALLWSIFPNASPHDIYAAVLHSSAQGQRRRGIVPPLLNAGQALHSLQNRYSPRP